MSRRPPIPDWLIDGLVATAPAAVVSGLPSTIVAVAQRGDVFEAAVAAGAVVAPRASRPRQLGAAVPVHLAVSVLWSVIFARFLPKLDRSRRRRPAVTLPRVERVQGARCSVHADPSQ